MTDLKEQINILMERGIRPVSADDIVRRQSAGQTASGGRTVRRGLPRPRLAGITVGMAAAACALALALNQAGPSARPVPARPVPAGPASAAPATLTAAFIQHVASASRLALAHSGAAVIRSRQTLQGKLQQTSTDNITFDGLNWNDALSQTFPAAAGQPASTQSAINRVVHGQAYDYFTAADGLAWYHDTGPNAVSSMHIPDPRKLLAELAPAAGFVTAGHAVIDGVAVQHLRATSLGGLSAVQLPDQWNTGKVVALDIWVDANGVVRKLKMTGSQTLYPGTMSLSELKRLPKGTTVTGWRYAEQSPVKRAKAVLRATAKGKGKNIIVELQPGSVPPQTQLTTTTVSFLGIGQRQLITVPAGAIPVYGLG